MVVTVSIELVIATLVAFGGIALNYGIVRGSMRSVVERVDKLEDRHDTHVEKLDKLCNDVSALVARLDMLFALGRNEALTRKVAL